MLHHLKRIGLLIVLAVGSWIGYTTYRYFCTIVVPVIELVGLQEGGCYAGDIACVLHGAHDYKISSASMWLDSTPLVEGHAVSKALVEHPFSIPTQTLNNGAHTLRVQLTDGTYNRQRAQRDYQFTVDNTPLQAAIVRPTGVIKIFQGRTLHVQFQVNKEIESATINLLSNSYPCFPESPRSQVYECFVPIACEEPPNEYLFTVKIKDNVGNSATLENKFQIMQFPFKKQQLNIAQKDEQQENLHLQSQKELETDMLNLLAQSPQKKLWRGAFYTPVDIAGITTEFGTIRTTQEKGRYAHKALDVMAPPKTVVWAPQSGIVVLKKDYEHNSGRTVVIDHGYGIFSMFFHLDSFADINVGDEIQQGKPVGKLGKSGYARGYHLHWEMRIGNIAIDPMQWTKHDF